MPWLNPARVAGRSHPELEHWVWWPSDRAADDTHVVTSDVVLDPRRLFHFGIREAVEPDRAGRFDPKILRQVERPFLSVGDERAEEHEEQEQLGDSHGATYGGTRSGCRARGRAGYLLRPAG